MHHQFQHKLSKKTLNLNSNPCWRLFRRSMYCSVNHYCHSGNKVLVLWPWSSMLTFFVQFSGQLREAGTGTSNHFAAARDMEKWWRQLELIRCAKLQSNHQHTNTHMVPTLTNRFLKVLRFFVSWFIFRAWKSPWKSIDPWISFWEYLNQVLLKCQQSRIV